MECNDYWTMGEFALRRKTNLKNSYKKRCNRFGKHNK